MRLCTFALWMPLMVQACMVLESCSIPNTGKPSKKGLRGWIAPGDMHHPPIRGANRLPCGTGGAATALPRAKLGINELFKVSGEAWGGPGKLRMEIKWGEYPDFFATPGFIIGEFDVNIANLTWQYDLAVDSPPFNGPATVQVAFYAENSPSGELDTWFYQCVDVIIEGGTEPAPDSGPEGIGVGPEELDVTTTVTPEIPLVLEEGLTPVQIFLIALIVFILVLVVIIFFCCRRGVPQKETIQPPVDDIEGPISAGNLSQQGMGIGGDHAAMQPKQAQFQHGAIAMGQAHGRARSLSASSDGSTASYAGRSLNRHFHFQYVDENPFLTAPSAQFNTPQTQSNYQGSFQGSPNQSQNQNQNQHYSPQPYIQNQYFSQQYPSSNHQNSFNANEQFSQQGYDNTGYSQNDQYRSPGQFASPQPNQGQPYYGGGNDASRGGQFASPQPSQGQYTDTSIGGVYRYDSHRRFDNAAL